VAHYHSGVDKDIEGKFIESDLCERPK